MRLRAFLGLALLLAPSCVPVAQAAPSTPTPQSPGAPTEFGPEISTLTPTFSWSAVAGASNYHFVVRKHQGSWDAGPIVLDQGYVYGTTFTIPAGVLEEGGSYRWNVRAFDGAGQASAYSGRLYFRTAAPPAPPASPSAYAPGATSEAEAPALAGSAVFSWSAVAGASSYTLRISKKEYGSANLVLTRYGIAGTSVSIPTSELPSDATQFRWGVTAVSASGESVQSNVLYFRLASASPPAAPRTVGPGASDEASAPVLPSSATFSWDPVAGATSYALRVSKKEYGASNVVLARAGIGGTSVTIPLDELPPGATQFRWGVTASNAAGEGAQSDVRYFRTQAPLTRPEPPTLASPGATSEAAAPSIGNASFSWQPVAGATSYTLRVSKKEYGSSNIVLTRGGIQGTSVTIDAEELPRDATQFRWGVTAHNAAGESDQSDVLYFRAGAVSAPAAPQLVGPGASTEEGAPVLGEREVFSWDPVAGATSYTLRVSKKEYGTTNLVLVREGLTGTRLAISRDELPANATQFRWGVTAHNGAGASAQSAILYVRTQAAALPPVAPTPIGPGAASEADAPTVGAEITLSWDPVEGAATYTLRVSKAPYGAENLVLTKAGLTATSVTLPRASLGNWTQFRWGVTASNAEGESPQSAVRYFRAEEARPTPVGEARASLQLADAPASVTSGDPVWRFGVRNAGTAPTAPGLVVKLQVDEPGDGTRRTFSAVVPQVPPGEERLVAVEAWGTRGLVEARAFLLDAAGATLAETALAPVFRGSPGSVVGPSALVDGRLLVPRYHPLLFDTFVGDFDPADPASVRDLIGPVPLVHLTLTDEQGALVRDADTYARFLWALLGPDATREATQRAGAPTLDESAWPSTRTAIAALQAQTGAADLALNAPSKLAQAGTSLLWGDEAAQARAHAELAWLLYGPDPVREERREEAQQAAQILVAASIFAGLANGLARGATAQLGAWRVTERAQIDGALHALKATSEAASAVATAGEELVARTGADLPAIAATACLDTRDAYVETASRADLLAVVVSAIERESGARATGFLAAARDMRSILDARARVLDARAEIVCDPDRFEAELLAEFHGNAAPASDGLRAFVDKYGSASAHIGTALVAEHAVKSAIGGIAAKAGLGPIPTLAFLTASGVGLLGNIGETAKHARIAEESALLAEILAREERLLDASPASAEGDLAQRAALLETARRLFAALAYEEAARLSGSHLRGLGSDPAQIESLRAKGELQRSAATDVLLALDRDVRALALDQGLGSASATGRVPALQTRYVSFARGDSVEPSAIRRADPALRVDVLRVPGRPRVDAFLVEPAGICDERLGSLFGCDRVMARVAERVPGGPLVRTRTFAFEGLHGGIREGPALVRIPDAAESVEVLLRRRAEADWAAGRADEVLRVGLNAAGELSAAASPLGNLVAIKSPADLSFFARDGAEIPAERFTFGHEKWYDLGERDPSRILVTGTGEGTYTLLVSRAVEGARETLTIANASTAPGAVDAVDLVISAAQRLEGVSADLSRPAEIVVSVATAEPERASTASTPPIDVSAGARVAIERESASAWRVEAQDARVTLAPNEPLTIEGIPPATVPRPDLTLAVRGGDPAATGRMWLVDGEEAGTERVLHVPRLPPGEHDVSYVETVGHEIRLASAKLTIVAPPAVELRDIAMRETGPGLAQLTLVLRNNGTFPIVAPVRLVGPAGATLEPQDVEVAPRTEALVRANVTGLASPDGLVFSIGERQWAIVRAPEPAAPPALLGVTVVPDGVLVKLVVRARGGEADTRVVVTDADAGFAVGAGTLAVAEGEEGEVSFTLQPYVSRVDVRLVDASSGSTLDERKGVDAALAAPPAPTPVPGVTSVALLFALAACALLARRRR